MNTFSTTFKIIAIVAVVALLMTSVAYRRPQRLAMSHYHRGNALRIKGENDLAIQNFDKAIEIYTRLVEQEGRSELATDLARSHACRGEALRDQGKLDAAIQDQEKAIELARE